jgi:hypothetical protein
VDEAIQAFTKIEVGVVDVLHKSSVVSDAGETGCESGAYPTPHQATVQ